MDSVKGRPMVYDEKWLNIARDYFTDPESHGDTIATKAGLACVLGVSRDTIYKYIKTNKVFSDTIKDGEAHQERQLINILLDKERFTAGSIFVAKNILGWRDKADVTSNDRTITGFEIVEDTSESD